METLNHLIASLDIFQVLIQSFPAIVEPLSHGFQIMFIHLFTSLKNFTVMNPGLISGTIFISFVYGGFTLAQHLKKFRLANQTVTDRKIGKR